MNKARRFTGEDASSIRRGSGIFGVTLLNRRKSTGRFASPISLVSYCRQFVGDPFQPLFRPVSDMLLTKIHKDFSVASIVYVAGVTVRAGVVVLGRFRCGSVGLFCWIGVVVFSTFVVGGGSCGCPFTAITIYCIIPCFFGYRFSVGVVHYATYRARICSSVSITTSSSLGWSTGVVGALIVATTSAHVNFDGWVLILAGYLDSFSALYVCSLLTVTRATGLVNMASALSIWVMSPNSSNSSDISEFYDLYVSTLAAVEGALSLPFLVLMLGNFIAC